MVQSYLWQMVRTRVTEEQLLDIPKSSAKHGRGQAPHADTHSPPPLCPPVSLEQLLANHNELMRMLIENETRRRADRPQQP
jgi:hypothetical protein